MGLCCVLSSLASLVPVVILVAVLAAVSWAIRKFVLIGAGGGPRIFKDLRGKHVLITGGSKGIGRAMAVEAVRHGASVVTIVARDRRQLDDARLELTQLANSSNPSQLIQAISLDLTADYTTIEAAIKGTEESSKQPIDILINNAGGAVEAEFERLPIDAFEKQMRLNYLSAVYTTRAVVESMKKRPNDHCRIVFVSSQAGQVGVYGFSAYAPTKYALRGFAETLRMELKPYNVWITISFPPNTRTEGFAEELKHMPEATRRISGETDDKVMEASKVAELIWTDVRSGRYQSTAGLDGWMLGILCAGMTPLQDGNILDLLQQMVLGGVLRLVGLFYVNKFDGIVAQCQRDEMEKSNVKGRKKAE